MNAPATLSRTSALTPLKAWRKKQMVDDRERGCRRTMKITDVPVLYGIPVSTWHGWEQPPGHKEFKPPNYDNMHRLFEITHGEVGPEDFYPVEEWRTKQMIDDPDHGRRRSMKITDVPALCGTPASTWRGREDPPGHKALKPPNYDNRHWLFEITSGEIGPESFRPVEEWKSGMGPPALVGADAEGGDG